MINKAQIMGRVGRIESKTISSTTKITNLSMATTKKFTKDGVKQEKVTWHNVTLFNQLSEIAEKFVKVGDLVYIAGEMDCSKYTGQDGVEKQRFSVIGHELQLLPKSKEAKEDVKADPDFALNDDIPF